ncbi:MAG: WD40 repeat domain-containing protein, partial [Cyanobacteria bacterium J06633_23]
MVQKNQTIVPSIVVLLALGIIGAAFGFIWNSLNKKTSSAQVPASPETLPVMTPTQRSLAQHTATVLSVDMQPDSTLLASGSYDQTVKLWELETGKVQRTLNHAGRVNAVVFTPNGRYLITGGGDGDIIVWDPETGAEKHRFTGGSGRIVSLAVSADGNLIASGGSNGTIRLWNLEQRRGTATLIESGAQINGLAFSSVNPQHLVSGDQDGVVALWDIADQSLVRTYKSGTDRVTDVAISPDGQYIASSSYDTNIQIWNLATAVVEQTLSGHDFVVANIAPSGLNATLA